MTLLQMTYVLEVERCGSINRAARSLFVSQSALSTAIAEVEKELGITIFRRSNRGIDLTPEGRELLAQIIPLVDGSRQLTRYYSERQAENRVTLSVASQRYPFCAKAFVEFLRLLDEPHGFAAEAFRACKNIGYPCKCGFDCHDFHLSDHYPILYRPIIPPFLHYCKCFSRSCAENARNAV